MVYTDDLCHTNNTKDDVLTARQIDPLRKVAVEIEPYFV